MNSNIDVLAEELGRSLLQRKQIVTVAESCTGGGVSQAITRIPGSSGWFHAGFIAYSNAIKQTLLGVDGELLAVHGAVSEAVACAMLEGALKMSEATFGVSVTGIAGPGGATSDKPVGTVCFAIGNKKSLTSSTQHFGGDRQKVREQGVIQALELLIEYSCQA